MWEDFGKALTNVAFAGVGLAALAAEQVVKGELGKQMILGLQSEGIVATPK